MTAEFIAKQKWAHPRDSSIVYSVRKLWMKDISKVAKPRNDDWGRAIVERLEQINDLVAAYAQYHNSYMKKLYLAPTIGNIKKEVHL